MNHGNLMNDYCRKLTFIRHLQFHFTGLALTHERARGQLTIHERASGLQIKVAICQTKS